MAWDDEKKAKAVELYQNAEPTAENSMEIVKEIAEQIGETANGVRMILTNAEVYIKKTGPAKPAAKEGAAASTRVSKEAAHGQLTSAIQAHGLEADSEIVSKLTGKAALHFAELFAKIETE